MPLLDLRHLPRMIFLVCAAILPAAGWSSPRERTRIDDDWRFSLDEGGSDRYPEVAFDDSSWRRVQLPHDYVVELGFDPHGDGSHGFRPKPIGWYRRTFVAPATRAGRTWLEFDGIFRNSQVWLNGHKLGGHPSGYTSFILDVTSDLTPGKSNVIAVKVDPSKNEGWWYEGGGIYRHVWLTHVPPIHVAHWGTFVSTTDLQPQKAQVRASVNIERESGAPTDINVESSVLRGNTVVATITTPVHLEADKAECDQTVSIPNPRVWSPESPNRYVLRTLITRSGQELDRYDTPFGIRTVRFDVDKGFFLNGRPLKLKGTANHQDFAAVGVAVTDNLERLRVQKLVAMGCNAWRCAHNPPTPELLDACDELGMLVLDENRHPGNTFAGKTEPGTPFSDMSEVDAMLLRDRNHPCVIAWSLCNEEWSLQTNAAGVRILKAVAEHVKSMDPTRPTTLAMGGGAWNANSPDLRDTVDVTGANYGADNYDSFHSRFPNTPLMATEFSAMPTTRGIYENDPVHGYTTSLPEEFAVQKFQWMKPQDVSWAAIASRSFVAGGFVWSGFDYRGEPTPYQWPYEWPDVIGGWGQMDLCGFPKDAYYALQSAWLPEDQPVVHVFPHWNWPGQEGKPRTVCVYTNADEVELLLNGAVVGARKPVTKNMHAEWSVPYAPGVLVAKGYRGGKAFGTDQVETSGDASKIILKSDSPTPTADPEDLVCVEISLQDAKGRFVATANDALTFSVSGPATIVGADNGDPSDHEPESTASLTTRGFSYRAFEGRGMVVLRPTGEAGEVVLTVTAAGMTSSKIAFRVK